MEFVKKKQILLFLKKFSRKNQGTMVLLLLLYVSAIALKGVAPAIEFRMKTMKDGMRLGESRA